MKKEKNSPSLVGSVMIAYVIVLLHILLVFGLGVLIVFFRGVANYMPLILIVGLSVVGTGTYYLYRRFKSQGKSLRETLNSPLFKGKSVEINLLGGIASVKINSNNSVSNQPAIGAGDQIPLIEDPESKRIRELVDLARSLENEHKNQKNKR